MSTVSLRTVTDDELLTSCLLGDEGPEPFYRRIGFRPTGELGGNGEIILALDLSA